jgi:hypothetical protein
MRLLLQSFILAFICASAFKAQARDATKCYVVLVDAAGAQRLLDDAPADLTVQQLNILAEKAVRMLGEFLPDVGEEHLTTKTFPLPDTQRVVTASVYYTDESIPGDSISLGLVVADRGYENAIAAEGNAVAETHFNEWTFIVRAKTTVAIGSRPHVLKLECHCMSPEDYKRQAREYMEFKEGRSRSTSKETTKE